MKPWYAVPILLCLLPAPGCRTSQHIAALQRDNRLKEDEIYRLRWQVDEYEEELERCRQARGTGSESAPAPGPGVTLLQRLGAARDGGESDPSEMSVQVGESISSDQFLQSRDLETPPDGPPAPPDPPDDDTDGIPAPAWPSPTEDASEADEAPRWSPPPTDSPEPQARSEGPRFGLPDEPSLPNEPDEASGPEEPAEPSPAEPSPAAVNESRGVARMRIDPAATGGHNLDGQVGDDGLRVVLELFDRNDRPLLTPSEVSIVLLDPDPVLQGDAARVARWDFTADEVAAAIRASDGAATGIPLKVVWRDKIPQNENLQVFVRYTTADGRQLEDTVEVRVRLTDGSASAGWRSAPQHSPPPPPEEDRATTRPEPSAASTRFASRRHSSAPSREPKPDAPRLKRPQWSPNRP